MTFSLQVVLINFVSIFHSISLSLSHFVSTLFLIVVLIIDGEKKPRKKFSFSRCKKTFFLSSLSHAIVGTHKNERKKIILLYLCRGWGEKEEGIGMMTKKSDGKKGVNGSLTSFELSFCVLYEKWRKKTLLIMKISIFIFLHPHNPIIITISY